MNNNIKELKELGNKEFRQKRYHSAIHYYKQCLKLCSNTNQNENKYIFLSNQSACYLRLHKYDLSLSYALKCVTQNPSFEKGYFRIVKSYIGLNNQKMSMFYMNKYIKNEKLKKMLQNEISENFIEKYYKFKRIDNMKSCELYDSGYSRMRNVFDFNGYYTFIYDNQVYQFGGYVADWLRSNDVYRLNRKSWEVVIVSGSKPRARSGHRIIYWEDELSLYIWGGEQTNDEEVLDGSIHKLYLPTMEWSILPSNGEYKPKSRTCSCFGRMGKTFYIIGGTIKVKPDLYDIACLIKYDLETGVWSKHPFGNETQEEEKKAGVGYLIDTGKKIVPSEERLGEKSKKNGKFMFSLAELLFISPNSYLFFIHEGKRVAVIFRIYNLPFIVFLESHSISKIVTIKFPSYLNSKIRYDHPFMYEKSNGFNPWSGRDTSLGLFFKYYDTLGMLYKDRYLIKFNMKKRRWEEFGTFISNTKVIDEIITEKINSTNENKNVNMISTDMQGIQRQHTQTIPDIRLKFDQQQIMRNDQFHSVIFNPKNGMMYCFLKSVWNFPFNSMVQLKIDQKEMIMMKECLKTTLIDNRYSDVTIIHDFKKGMDDNLAKRSFETIHFWKIEKDFDAFEFILDE